MKTVSVSSLRARLAEFFREVRRAPEIQILDRGVPIARLLRVTGDTEEHDDDRRRRLMANGVLRPGSGKTAAILKAPPLKLPVRLSDALRNERDDRV